MLLLVKVEIMKALGFDDVLKVQSVAFVVDDGCL